MKKSLVLAGIAIQAMHTPGFAAEKAPASLVQMQVDWPAFMARQDLVWERLPSRWNEGAFVGNGLLGAMIWRDGNELRLEVGRTDINQNNYRLPIGQLKLRLQGQIQGGTVRLSLWNAEVQGTLETDQGKISWRVFTHAEDEVSLLEWRGEGAEANATVEFTPSEAVNPRKTFRKEPLEAKEINPKFEVGTESPFQFVKQDLNGGTGYATTWVDAVAPEDWHRVFFTTQKGRDAQAAFASARTLLSQTSRGDFTAWEARHRAWWHSYFSRSFVSIPDGRLENFYWIQLYKLASGTRSGRPMLDLMGPWFRSTPWPRIWWNLNTQLTYWPTYASNHLEISNSLPQMLSANRENLIKNVPAPFQPDSAAISRSSGYDGASPISPTYALPPAEREAILSLPQGEPGAQADSTKELGNLTWALHNVWLQYRYSMDEKLARETLYPLLRRSINLYLHLLEPAADGTLHLPISLSPEYKTAHDTNYDLALLRWGLQTLPELANRLKIKDPLLPKWQEVNRKLTPYPTNEDGMMIGRDVPLSTSHRHFSHLLMFYPLRSLSTDIPENRALLEKSVAHWLGFKGALQGYSYTGGAAMMASLGRGDEAYGYLNSFLKSFVQPNTMYLESGPVIETPLSAAASLQEMMLQSWGTGFDNTLRVFPAMPAAWKEASFHNMLAEGGFLVSAARHEGKTAFINVRSLSGEPLKLKLESGQKWDLRGSRRFKVQNRGNDILSIDLKKGEDVLILPQGTTMPLVVSPVDAHDSNYYGLKAKG